MQRGLCSPGPLFCSPLTPDSHLACFRPLTKTHLDSDAPLSVPCPPNFASTRESSLQMDGLGSTRLLGLASHELGPWTSSSSTHGGSLEMQNLGPHLGSRNRNLHLVPTVIPVRTQVWEKPLRDRGWPHCEGAPGGTTGHHGPRKSKRNPPPFSGFSKSGRVSSWKNKSPSTSQAFSEFPRFIRRRLISPPRPPDPHLARLG